MKPYGGRYGKFKTENKDGIPGTTKSISRYDKLVTKNANRSMNKKGRKWNEID